MFLIAIHPSLGFFRIFFLFVVLAMPAGVHNSALASENNSEASAAGQEIEIRTILLPPLVITATRQPARQNTLIGDTTIIDRQSIENLDAAVTTADLLRMQAGIEIKSNGGAGSVTGLQLRGNPTRHSLLLIDGMRSGSATVGEANWAYLPISEIERIEILRGPASFLYGSETIGGVVQVFTRRGQKNSPPRINMELSAGSWQTSSLHLGVSGGSERLLYNIQTTRRQSEGINATLPTHNSFNPDRDGYKLNTLSTGLDWTLAPGHRLQFSLLNASGKNRYDATSYDDSFQADTSGDWYQNVNNSSWNLQSVNRLNDHWSSTLQFGQSRDDTKNHENDGLSSEYNTKQQQLSWQNDFRLPGEGGLLLLGVERQSQRVSGSRDYPVKSRHIDAFLLGWSGVFGTGNTHNLQANLRQDQNSQFGSHNTGMLGYAFSFKPNWRLSLAANEGFKAPSFNDLYWPNYGNHDLRPEKAFNTEVALHFHDAKIRSQASAVVYRNKVKDLISWVDDGTGQWRPQNTKRASLTGFTLNWQQGWREWILQASYDHLEARDQNSGKRLPYRSQNTGRLRIGHQQGDWRWGVEALAANGRRYADESNSVPLDGYQLINLNATYRLSPHWSFFLRGENIFDESYELNKDYNTNGASWFAGIRFNG